MSTHHDRAQECVEDVRAMQKRIPYFVFPTPGTERRRLARAASVSPEFVELSAVAVTNDPALVREGGADPDHTRDLMSFAEAYEPLADELEALAQFVRHSAVVARNKAGSEALTTFALARRLAKRPEHAHLRPVVEAMHRALGFRRRKPKPQPEPDTPSEP